MKIICAEVHSKLQSTHLKTKAALKEPPSTEQQADSEQSNMSSDDEKEQANTGKSVIVADKEATGKKTQQRGPNWKDAELQLLTEKVLANMELLSGELSYTDDITNTQ